LDQCFERGGAARHLRIESRDLSLQEGDLAQQALGKKRWWLRMTPSARRRRSRRISSVHST
jgi:hypothetical protein